MSAAPTRDSALQWWPEAGVRLGALWIPTLFGCSQGGDEAPEVDLDGDGFAAPGDCDDTDPATYPLAYDRPNDGIDQDCLGGDRVLNGFVVDPGEDLTVHWKANVPQGPSKVDIAWVFDTYPGSNDIFFGSVDVDAVTTALEGKELEPASGMASYEDYPYDSMGSTRSGDLPFHLEWPIDAEFDTGKLLELARVRGGSDSTEAAFEALYQALTGAGYDLGCDGAFDAGYDVPPWRAGVHDPFGGTAAGSAPDDTLGDLGGMGFREGALPLIVLVVGTPMRDPDGVDASPEGCPLDAGSLDVAAAAADLGAWFVIARTSDWGNLAERASDFLWSVGSVADKDGNGSDEPLLVDATRQDAQAMQRLLATMLTAVDAAGAGPATIDAAVTVTDDAGGVVSSVSPASLPAIDRSATPTVDVTITLTATGRPSDEPEQSEVRVALTSDDAVLDWWQFTVEVAPQ